VFGLGEDAHFGPRDGLLGAVDVGEAEQLAADGDADEARHVGVHEGVDKYARRSDAAAEHGGLVSLDVGIHELKEEAVTARAGDDAVGDCDAALLVWEERGLDEVGGARGLGELQGHAPRRRLDHFQVVDHRPWIALLE
jgi:hypothetical protein